MGSNFSESLTALEIPLGEQIRIHLQSNHYPPVPVSMVDPCIEAIEACSAGDNGALIDLPEPVKWRGESQAPAYAIVEGHHLEPWVVYE